MAQKSEKNKTLRNDSSVSTARKTATVKRSGGINSTVGKKKATTNKNSVNIKNVGKIKPNNTARVNGVKKKANSAKKSVVTTRISNAEKKYDNTNNNGLKSVSSIQKIRNIKSVGNNGEYSNLKDTNIATRNRISRINGGSKRDYNVRKVSVGGGLYDYLDYSAPNKRGDANRHGNIKKVRRVRQLKLKTRNVLMLCVAILLVVFSVKFLVQPATFDYKLKRVGYTKSEITRINQFKMTEVAKQTLVSSEYNKHLINILEDKLFNMDKIELYLDIFSMYKGKYDSNILKIANEKYYKSLNAERYLDYYLNNVEKTSRSIVEDVNCNLDSEYYKSGNKADLTKGILVLVNKYNELEDDYVPKNLVVIDKKYGYEKMINETVYYAFIELYEAMEKQNLHITIISPYRSYKLQASLYNNYVSKNGKEKADTFSARPGYSEHQTGLAIDVAASDMDYTKFASFKEYQWMIKNSYKYGFILRYPEGKECQTGYTFEPWHYRYVGKKVAKYIYDNKITFDEYYEYFLK